MNGAARRALSFIPLFCFAVLVFGQFAPVIVVSSAYSVESIADGIEGVAESREVMVTKNISIPHQSISKDRRPLMTLPIIRQAGCYLRERFRFGRIARADYLTFKKISLQWGERTRTRHSLTSDTYKIYLSYNSRGSPIIVEHVANMFRIFDTLRRRDSDNGIPICGGYNNKNEWSLCSIECLFRDEGGFQGGIGGFICDRNPSLHIFGLVRPDFLHRFDGLFKAASLPTKYDQLKKQNYGRRYGDENRDPIIPTLFVFVASVLIGFLLILFGSERLDNERRVYGAALICFGLLLALLGIGLCLYAFLRDAPDVF